MARTWKQTAWVFVTLSALFPIGMAAEVALPTIPPAMTMGYVATVGPARIASDQVFELWNPVWQETLAKVRNGKMSPAEGDRRLNEEWQRAIRSLIKDELFYQEAEQEHNAYINSIVERQLRQSGGGDSARQYIAREVRQAMEVNLERYFREINAIYVREAGGLVKLHKVLEGRGLTFLEWQNRLKKKAFTENYLHQILKPRAPDPGPRQVQQYYASHPEEFSIPGLVRFRHIFFSTARRGVDQAREDAIDVWEQLVDGEVEFDTAVSLHSDDEESKRRNGLETGEEAADPEREAWLADIRSALRDESPDELGPILESPFGFHVAQLIAIGPERKIPFSEVRRDIERKLQSEVWEEETDRYFAAIRKNTPIRVHMPDFPPSLSCAAQAGLAGTGPRIVNTSRPEISAPRSRRNR